MVGAIASRRTNLIRDRSDTLSMLGQVAHQSGWQLPYVPFIGLGIDARQVERAKLYRDGTPGEVTAYSNGESAPGTPQRQTEERWFSETTGRTRSMVADMDPSCTWDL